MKKKGVVLMELLEELKTKGVNIEEGLERFMGNRSLYEKMLGKFVELIDKSSINTDFDCNNYDDIIEKAHAIKGATGNLSIKPLYEAYTEIVNLLRAKQPEQSKVVLEGILSVQADIINCIQNHTL